ncbi:MAG: T9SS type A sorting domain-containing protein [Lentimicrobium sp.]|nr:T9SS type A sorting domain-containing protein [Lentimicrobium sp.]
MRKFTLSMITMLAFVLTTFNLQAQQRELVYGDDFESYAVNDFLAQSNPEMWTTWSNAPGTTEDAKISDEQAFSGTKSVKVDGVTDLVLKLGNKTSGAYEINFNYYVPVGMGGYYNIQHYEAPGVEWAFEIYFKADGTGFMNAGGDNAATFNYTQGTWFTIENLIDLDADWAQVYFDDVLIHEWQYSLQAQGQPGMLQLGAVNFYAGVVTGSGETPTYYFDDIFFDVAIEQVLYYNEFDEYTVGDYIAVVDPDWWTTWTNAPGTAEDALIVNEQSNSPENSIKVDGTSDLVFKMGNKTSGKYVLDFKYYVPSNFGAYYNLQHYEAPGVEWALEVYFATNGTGTVNAGGTGTASFTYNHDVWMSITNIIDIDSDWAQLYINDVLIHEWQFSLLATGGPGMLQLGAANFYAGAPTGETPTYFLDDLAYIALVQPALGPIIDIDGSDIISAISQGESEVINRSITNAGGMPLVFDVVASFDEPISVKSTSPWVSTTPVGKFNDTPALAPNYTPGNTAPANREVVLNYDGENASAIGSATAAQWRVAAMFPASMVAQYNGMYVEAVSVFINETASAHKIQIYDMGSINLPGPGALLYEQDFTALPTSWNNITLNTPVYVSGRDLWVGYRFNKPADVYPAGVDAGPANPNGDWIATGPGWGHLSDNPALDANWNIRAMLNGEAGPVWLSVNPEQGALEGGGSDDLAIELNTAGMSPSNYSAKLHVRSNDPENEQVDINVMLTIITGINELGEQTYVTVFPNPANDVLFIKGNTDIKTITLSNILGQVVYENVVGQRDTRIATGSFETGMYILTIQTSSGIATQKIMIQ